MPRHELSQFERNMRNIISNNLKKHSNGITQAQLSEMTGIPASTISGYFAQRSTPNAGAVQKLADALGIEKSDIDPRYKGQQLFVKETESDYSVRTTTDKIIDVVKLLNSDNQHNVLEYAEQQLANQKNEKNIIELPQTRIKLLGAVSAGTGEELTDDPIDKDYTGWLPDYDYALLVNGDSMEPLFSDQQIIFVKYSQEAFDGQIIVAYVDGKAYVKKFHRTSYGCQLISLNKKYAPIEIENGDDLQIKGVVL